MNINTNINTTSLDQLILTSAPATPEIQNLLLYSAGGADAGQLSFQQARAGVNFTITNPATFAAGAVPIVFSPHTNTVGVGTTGATKGQYTKNDPTSGDLFNQSQAFRRDLVGIATSTVEINNIPLTPQPLKPWEMFNETLIALGNANLDMSAGVHEGCLSLSHFCKYYGCHIVSLENIQTDGFYKSGLDGKSSALNIVWKPSFESAAVNSIIPVIYAKTTRMLVISEGHNVVVIV
jgi:hypothetical protein